MAAKGAAAKDLVNKKLKEVFGEDYIGPVNGKTYVWADDGGERVQIAIALTCPKTPVTTVNVTQLDYGADGIDFEVLDRNVIVDNNQIEFTQEEENNITTLMEKLGL